MRIRALMCPFLYLYPTSHPASGAQVFQKARDLLLDCVKAIFRISESNLDTLNTVDLGPKRPFSVSECALRARLTGPQFTAQVAAVVSLVEAPANHCKAAAVAKEVMAIKYGNTTGHSIEQFLESPLAGKHPKPISKGTKAAAAEAAVVTAAVSISDSRRSHRRGRFGRGQASGC